MLFSIETKGNSIMFLIVLNIKQIFIPNPLLNTQFILSLFLQPGAIYREDVNRKALNVLPSKYFGRRCLMKVWTLERPVN